MSLDLELAQIGNPAAVLGYIRNFIEKMTGWDSFMAAYAEAGGPAIPESILDFYTLWCSVRLYCLVMRTRAGVAMGMIQDTETTYACAHFIPKKHHLISQGLRRIFGSVSSN